mgnify:CR=1 FL=1
MQTLTLVFVIFFGIPVLLSYYFTPVSYFSYRPEVGYYESGRLYWWFGDDMAVITDWEAAETRQLPQGTNLATCTNQAVSKYNAVSRERRAYSWACLAIGSQGNIISRHR